MIADAADIQIRAAFAHSVRFTAFITHLSRFFFIYFFLMCAFTSVSSASHRTSSRSTRYSPDSQRYSASDASALQISSWLLPTSSTFLPALRNCAILLQSDHRDCTHVVFNEINTLQFPEFRSHRSNSQKLDLPFDKD